ncbi:MAG: type II secretion system protein [Proteocatella sp.]
MKSKSVFKNGYTLVETIVALLFMALILTAAINLVTSISVQYNKSIARKELIESGDYLEQVIRKEFKRSDEIEEILDIDGNEIYTITDVPTAFKCICLKKSRYTLNQNGYVEEFIYGGKFLESQKKPLFISKQKTAIFSSKDYEFFSGFEVGNHVEKMSIAKINNTQYELWIELRYRDDKISYNKDFIVDLQTL